MGVMNEEEMKIAMKVMVKESFDSVLTEATESRRNTLLESSKKEVEEVEEEEADTGKKDGDKGGDDDEDEEEEEESDLSESLDVSATLKGKGNRDSEFFKVKNLKELTKIIKAGKYESVTVTNKRTGDESEYRVDGGKLVIA